MGRVLPQQTMDRSGSFSRNQAIAVRLASDQYDQAWSTEHLKVLYLISKYVRSLKARNSGAGAPDASARAIFEGIQAGALQFDYAPKVVHLYEDMPQCVAQALT